MSKRWRQKDVLEREILGDSPTVKRRRVILLVIGALLIAIAVVILWPREKEPEYQGKTLTEWLDIYEGGVIGYIKDPERQEAADALRNIGTNALPWLIKWISNESPNWRRKLSALTKLTNLHSRGRVVVRAYFT